MSLYADEIPCEALCHRLLSVHYARVLIEYSMCTIRHVRIRSTMSDM